MVLYVNLVSCVSETAVLWLGVVRVCLYVHGCMRVHLCVRVCACMCECVYMCTSVHVRVYTTSMKLKAHFANMKNEKVTLAPELVGCMSGVFVSGVYVTVSCLYVMCLYVRCVDVMCQLSVCHVSVCQLSVCQLSVCHVSLCQGLRVICTKTLILVASWCLFHLLTPLTHMQ